MAQIAVLSCGSLIFLLLHNHDWILEVARGVRSMGYIGIKNKNKRNLIALLRPNERIYVVAHTRHARTCLACQQRPLEETFERRVSTAAETSLSALLGQKKEKRERRAEFATITQIINNRGFGEG